MINSPSNDTTVTNLKNSDSDFGNDLHNAANQAGRKVRSMYNAASDEVAHASDVVTTEIRSNPIRSSAVALGVGVILGMLLRR
jgi:ElaB/YqjD/DUF883 family membrane-anchored ribosome-binding protein